MMDEALDYLEKRQVFSLCIQNSIFFCVVTITSQCSSRIVIFVYVKTVLLIYLDVTLLLSVGFRLNAGR